MGALKSLLYNPVGETRPSSGESDWMLHGVPIIFLTAVITPEETSDGRRVEGHDVAAKPMNRSELITVVEENLAARCAA